jgi:uncharacterized protein YkwD
LLLAVCLLVLVFPLTGLAQNKGASTIEKNPKADKTLSSSVAPVVKVAPKPDYLSPLELEILDEMNLARTEPQKYAAFVEEFKKYYRGTNLSIPGRQTLITAEGTVAVDEAISFLRAATPLPAFQVSKGVCSAAADHVRDLVSKGLTGHKGSDGSTPNARLDRYGRWDMAVGENIVYDISTARQIVIGFLIDDGVANRGHRRNIFDSKYRIAGVSISNASGTSALGVINFTAGFTEKPGGLK